MSGDPPNRNSEQQSTSHGRKRKPEGLPEGPSDDLSVGDRFVVSRIVDTDSGVSERRWFIKERVEGRHIGPGGVIHAKEVDR